MGEETIASIQISNFYDPNASKNELYRGNYKKILVWQFFFQDFVVFGSYQWFIR